MTAPLDLNALERLALAATPGPWVADMGYVGTLNATGRSDETAIAWAIDFPPCSDENAAFIAAANPATILDMIRRLRAAEVEEVRHGKH